MTRRLLALACALCALLVASQALYQDQAGSYEWHTQLVGTASTALLHKTRPRLFVATEQNALASLNLKDGSIGWRRLFADGVDQVRLMDRPSVVVSLSASSGALRTWDQIEGFMKWEDVRAGAGAAGSSGVALHVSEESGLIISYAAGALEAHNAADGARKWRTEVDVKGADVVHLVEAGSSVRLVAYKTGSASLTTATADLQNGSGVHQSTLSTASSLSSISATTGAAVAIVSSDGASLCIVSGSGDASCRALSSLAPKLSAPALLSATAGGFVLSSDAGAALLSVSASGQPQLASFFAGASAATEPIPLDSGAAAVGLFAVDQKTGDLTFRVVDAKSGSQLHEERVPGLLADRRGVDGVSLPTITAASLGSFKRTTQGGGDGFRAVLSFSDSWLVLLQQGQAVWAREEALASITTALFVDLPTAAVTTGGAAAAPDAAQLERSSLEKRLRFQLLSIKVQFSVASRQEQTEFAGLRRLFEDRTLPHRDLYGLRRQIVALTSVGRVLSLHNGDGRVLWGTSYGRAAPPQHMHIWRTFHDKAHAPQLVLLRDGGGGGSSLSFASVVDAHSGKELSRSPLPYRVGKVLPTHRHLRDGTAEQSTLLVVSGELSQPQVHVLPDSEAARGLVSREYRSLHFWLQDGSAKAGLAGYGFQAGAEGQQQTTTTTTTTLTPVQLWRLELPGSLLAAVPYDATEPVHSSVKVLGDRSMKYKYLNPNTIFVATGPPLGASPSSSSSPPLTAHVIDAVTGRVLYRQVHDNCRGPVHAVLSENWAVYQYWDGSHSRWVMTVVELYDATPRTFDVVEYLLRGYHPRPFSSYEEVDLEAWSQSYYSRLPLHDLAVTRTARGITTRQLLLATAAGQVYALDKRFVDPRRPHKQKLSAEEMEERLVPYADTLPTYGTLFATLDKQVLGLHAGSIVVAPTTLESTCLMFAHGVDIYATSLKPAKAFDALEPDFNYGLLVLAIIGLFVGTLLMSRMTNAARLKSKWQ